MTCHRGAMRRVLAMLLAALALTVALTATPNSPAVPLHAAAAWAPAGALPDLGAGRIWSVAISPVDPRMLLAGTDNGVYRSVDAGATWAQSGLAATRAWVVGFDLRKPDPAFAGLDGSGLARSDDGGATWTVTTAGLPSPTVRTLTFGLSGIVAGTSNGVAVSADGHEWRAAGLAGYDVAALTVVTNTPSLTVLAGADNAPAGAGGYLFLNAGLNQDWKPVDLPGVNPARNPITVSALASGPIAADTMTRPILAATSQGLFRTADNATNWALTYPAAGADAAGQTLRLTSAAFSPLDPKLVFAGSDAGGSSGGQLLRSTDGGLTFATFDQGLPADARNAAALAVSAANPPLVVVAVDPPARAGLLFAQTDQTAPAPAPTGPPEAAGTLPAATPAPSAAPEPTAAPAAPPAPAGSTGLRRLLDWPLPLAAELLVLVVGVYIVLRRRQRRLDVEGPP